MRARGAHARHSLRDRPGLCESGLVLRALLVAGHSGLCGDCYSNSRSSQSSPLCVPRKHGYAQYVSGAARVTNSQGRGPGMEPSESRVCERGGRIHSRGHRGLRGRHCGVAQRVARIVPKGVPVRRPRRRGADTRVCGRTDCAAAACGMVGRMRPALDARH